MEKQYQFMRETIVTANACKKPDAKTFETVLLPKVQASAETLSRFKEANRKERDWFTHLTVLAEAAPVVGWVANNVSSSLSGLKRCCEITSDAKPKPAPFIGEVKEMAAYYGNKVMKEFKEK